MTHTPGPWEAFDFNIIGHLKDHEDETQVIATVEVDDWNAVENEDEQLANARLIAAAPDLLFSCKALLTAMEEWDGDLTETNRNAMMALMREAHTAIEKAEASK